jgi:PAS domain S-box-containing protein
VVDTEHGTGVVNLTELTLASAGDAIVTVDARGVISSWNPRAAALLGHAASDAVGQTLALIVPEAFRPRHVAGFHAALGAGHLRHDGRPVRVRATTATGESLTLAMTLGLLKEDGAVIGAVAVLRPVVELEVFA